MDYKYLFKGECVDAWLWASGYGEYEAGKIKETIEAKRLPREVKENKITAKQAENVEIEVNDSSYVDSDFRAQGFDMKQLRDNNNGLTTINRISVAKIKNEKLKRILLNKAFTNIKNSRSKFSEQYFEMEKFAKFLMERILPQENVL